jgi:hypothetical protein
LAGFLQKAHKDFFDIINYISTRQGHRTDHTERAELSLKMVKREQTEEEAGNHRG